MKSRAKLGFEGDSIVTLYSLLQLLKTRSPRLPRLPNDLRTVAVSNEQRGEMRQTRQRKAMHNVM